VLVAMMLSGSLVALGQLLLLMVAVAVGLPLLLWGPLRLADKGGARLPLAPRLALRRLARRPMTTLPMLAAMVLALAVMSLASQVGPAAAGPVARQPAGEGAQLFCAQPVRPGYGRVPKLAGHPRR
jgi:putative ABC transport system permease protein